jgi:hypothetical protein
MTAFVRSFSTQQLLPPWRSEGCVRWGFVINIPRDCVSDYLKKYMNVCDGDMPPYSYTPVDYGTADDQQYGMIIFAEHPDIFSTRENVHPNALSYSEVLWTIPANRTQNVPGNISQEKELVWLQPFSFCNNATVVFGSREIWGSDKVYATIDKTELSTHEWKVDVAIEGIKKFSPRAYGKAIGCMRIEKGQSSEVQLQELLNGSERLDEFARLLMGKRNEEKKDWAIYVGRDTPPAQIEFNTLKQFRSAEADKMGEAIYRAIVASRAMHNNVGDLAFYDAKDAKVEFMWSDSVAQMVETLFDGKKPPGWRSVRPDEKPAQDGEVDWTLPRVSMEVELAFSFTSDVVFDDLETLHTYGEVSMGEAEPQLAASPPT